MNIQSHGPKKVRLVVDCTLEERARVKMLAARKHMTISEYLLSFARAEIANRSKVPNQTTLDAHQEALDGKGTSYASIDDFWLDMGIDRNAGT
jgi:hypothetical protein